MVGARLTAMIDSCTRNILHFGPHQKKPRTVASKQPCIAQPFRY